MSAYSYSFLMRQHKNRLLALFFHRIVKILDYPSRYIASYSFARNSKAHSTLLVSSNAYCKSKNPENITIGMDCVIRGYLMSVGPGRITIGDNCYIGDNSIIYSLKHIKIGNNVLIAHNVNIFDNNSHPIDPLLRQKHFKSFLEEEYKFDFYGEIIKDKVEIQDNVWIGFNTTILKGIKIGEGAIIGAGSVITKDIPPFVVVAGNPAKVVKILK